MSRYVVELEGNREFEMLDNMQKYNVKKEHIFLMAMDLPF